MPIYEFYCPSCHNRRDVVVRGTPVVKLSCPACGSELKRLLSRFAIRKSMIHEESGEPGRNKIPDYYKDPRNIGRWAEKKFQEAGVEVPPELRKKIDAAREGVMPEPINDI